MPIETRCDLVLLSWNHLEVTRPCVESILAHTTVPSRLIVIDQNSDEETKTYLRGLSSTSTVHVEVLFNPANVGYPHGMNQGFRHGNSPYVCFLNNDILVPPGWLEEMIHGAESDPVVGTVSPASNTFNIHPPSGMDWLTFAQTFAPRRGQWIEVPYGEGFCLLGRRSILSAVGGFDETTYEQIYFEDADLGQKIHAQGLRCVMTYGTYVWHHGGKTMNTHPDRLRLFEENQKRFTAKWGPRGKRQMYILLSPCDQTLCWSYEQARSEANRSGEIRFLTRTDPGVRNLIRHMNIRLDVLSGWRLPWMALAKAFKRKKVREIYCDSAWLRGVMRALRWIHGAEVQLIPSGR